MLKNKMWINLVQRKHHSFTVQSHEIHEFLDSTMKRTSPSGWVMQKNNWNRLIFMMTKDERYQLLLV